MIMLFLVASDRRLGELDFGDIDGDSWDEPPIGYERRPGPVRRPS